MNRKSKLLLVFIVVNLFGAGVLIISRSAGSRSGSGVEAGNAVTAIRDNPVRQPRPEFTLPARPSITVDADAPAEEQEIARLRSAAFDLAEFAVAELPASADALCLLGKLHLRSGDAAVAQKIWAYAQELEPQSPEAFIDLGHYDLILGNFEKAIGNYRQALERAPKSAEIYKSLAEAQMSQREYAEAAISFDRYLADNPSDATVWCKLASVYQQLKDSQKSIASYERALKADAQSVTALQGLAAIHRSTGEVEKANGYSKRMAELVASQPRAADNRATMNPDLIKARDVFDFVCRLAVDTLTRADKGDAAIGALEKARQKLPTSTLLRSILVDLYGQRKLFDRALPLLKEQCQQTPDNPQVWIRLGMEYIKVRQLDSAEESLRQAIELQPANAEAYSLLAQVQLPADRDPSNAVSCASKAVELSPTAANHFILGTTLFFTGDVETARVEIEHAVRLDPSNPEYRAALERLQ